MLLLHKISEVHKDDYKQAFAMAVLMWMIATVKRFFYDSWMGNLDLSLFGIAVFFIGTTLFGVLCGIVFGLINKRFYDTIVNRPDPVFPISTWWFAAITWYYFVQAVVLFHFARLCLALLYGPLIISQMEG
jgi:hypothetical protein